MPSHGCWHDKVLLTKTEAKPRRAVLGFLPYVSRSQSTASSIHRAQSSSAGVGGASTNFTFCAFSGISSGAMSLHPKTRSRSPGTVSCAGRVLGGVPTPDSGLRRGESKRGQKPINFAPYSTRRVSDTAHYSRSAPPREHFIWFGVPTASDDERHAAGAAHLLPPSGDEVGIAFFRLLGAVPPVPPVYIVEVSSRSSGEGDDGFEVSVVVVARTADRIAPRLLPRA